MKTYKRNLASRLINWWFRSLTQLGLGAPYRQILTVPGRKTGRPHSTPVDVIEVGGDRWLVAGYGPANWVLNTRAHREVTLRRGGLSQTYKVEEVGAEDASPYNDKNVYEFEYTPNGVGTGTCIGVGVTPGNNTPVDLEPCGVSAKTVWILNPAPGGATATLMSAATSNNFANPYSLTDLKPGANRQLFTWPLDAGGIVHNPFNNQLWSFTFGVLPAS